MDIESFVLARVDEEERRAQWEIDSFGADAAVMRRIDMCRAKRALALDLAAARRVGGSGESLLHQLAARYAEHPDYDETWRQRRG